MNKLKVWMSNQSWTEILNEKLVDKKAVLLQNILLEKINQFLPEKNRLISSDDDPWVTEEVKKLKRQREYSKNKKLVINTN